MEEVQEAVAANADVIMLDNMDIDRIREAVGYINKRAVVEISGGINKTNLKQMIEAGVDLISIGALTHGAVSVDISMRIQ